jgi:tol-pal system protein YbgF
LLENKITLETLNEIETLKTEVQQLHGKLDEQQHAMEVLTQRQEKLFLDLEQRIGQLPKNSSTQIATKEGYSIPSYSPQSVKKTENISTLSPKPSLPLPQAEAQNKVEVHSLNDSKTTIDKVSSEQDLYNAAYKLIDAKRYKEALVAFQDFLWQFPDGQYAANAHYWLGEIYLSEWHNDRHNKLSLDKAISSFKTVTVKHAKHHKAADSLLKLGIIEADKENWPAAKEYFTKLKQQYPGSSRAHMADIRLQKIKQ